MNASYVQRPALDRLIAERLSSGAGVYALEGPSGAGKSAALLHGLLSERERRGKAGRGHVRLLQLWGDEPPSLFARRLVREVGFLHLIAYPQPQQLAKLVADMAQAVPGLGSAGKLLGALVPDDLRPLHLVAAQALGEAGSRAIESGGGSGGPLVIGIDLLGGEVSAPVREFFTRLSEQLPPTVILLFAQPGGPQSLLPVPAAARIHVGPFSAEEAQVFLSERLGPLDADSLVQLETQLSLLPGDLVQIANLYPFLGKDPRAGLTAVAGFLSRDIAGRYQQMYESVLAQPGIDSRALELCSLVAVTSRPQQPLTLEQAQSRMLGAPPPRPTELAQLRQSPLVRALCAAVAPVGNPVPLAEEALSGGTPSESLHASAHAAAHASGVPVATSDSGSGSIAVSPGGKLVLAPDVGWPLLAANAQAREGVLLALRRNGLLDIYQKRWLDELLGTLRTGPSREGLLAGVQALSLLTERAFRDAQALGQAVAVLGELETLFWRAGWHRTFAELYDALLPHLWRAGVTPRDVAPKLFFRRARVRVQGVDWAGQPSPSRGPDKGYDAPGLREELPLAIEELTELLDLGESHVVQARVRIGLPTDGAEVSDWCRHLPWKARQARGYTRVLRLLLGGAVATPVERQESIFRLALDDILAALSHFVAEGQKEDCAQTLTILADAYSTRDGLEADRFALLHYEKAIALAGTLGPVAAFTLGIIYRSLGNHHRRHDRGELAAEAYAEARRHLLRSPDARMGTLLAGLLA